MILKLKNKEVGMDRMQKVLFVIGIVYMQLVSKVLEMLELLARLVK